MLEVTKVRQACYKEGCSVSLSLAGRDSVPGIVAGTRAAAGDYTAMSRRVECRQQWNHDLWYIESVAACCSSCRAPSRSPAPEALAIRAYAIVHLQGTAPPVGQKGKTESDQKQVVGP